MPKAIPDRQPNQAWEESLSLHLRRGLEDAPGGPLPGQRWAKPKHLTAQPNAHEAPPWEYRPGGIFLGFRDGRAVGRVDDKHIFVVAGSRAGKGVSVILPNACLWPGSLVVVDPKGDVAKATAKTRETRLEQKTYALDPFERTSLPPAYFNPLDEVYPPGFEVSSNNERANGIAVDNADLIADSLIVPNEREPHWTDAARLLLKGLILYTLTLPKDERHLVTVRKLLMLAHPDTILSDDDLAAKVPWDNGLFELLEQCQVFDGLIASIGRTMMSMADKERASIRTTAIAQTNFLESPQLKPCLSKSSFRLADIKRVPTTLYLCLPANRMGTHARWLRVIINMLLHAFEEENHKPAHPVLMCLDEFNVLGKMQRVSDAAGQMAGFSCKLMIVLQDITQLKQHYRDTWETFVGNSGVFIAFGNSDVSTLDYVSKKLGTCTVMAASSSSPGLAASLGGASGNSLAPHTVPLLAPHEVENILARERNRLLVAYPGMLPMILQRCISHDDPFFKPLLASTTPRTPPTEGFRPNLRQYIEKPQAASSKAFGSFAFSPSPQHKPSTGTKPSVPDDHPGEFGGDIGGDKDSEWV